MDIRITDILEHANGNLKGSGYISVGNDQFPNLITIFFGMAERPSRDQAKVIAKAIAANGHLMGTCRVSPPPGFPGIKESR